MKRVILLLLLFSPMLTGCTKVDVNVDLVGKNTALVSLNLFSDKDITKDEVSIIKNNYKQFIDTDYVTDIYFSDDKAKISAVKLTKNLKKNDVNLSLLGFKSNQKSGKFIEIKNNLFVTSYNVDLLYDFAAEKKFINTNTEKTETKGLKPEYLQKYGDKEISKDNPEVNIKKDFEENSQIIQPDEKNINAEQKQTKENIFSEKSDFRPQFSITLPSAASYNNADNVENNTYYWTIRKDSPTNIKLQYVVYNSFAITILILMIIIILFVLSKLILRHDSQKRIGSNN